LICQSYAGTEELLRVIELLARSRRRGTPGGTVSLLVNLEFREHRLLDLVGIHARRAFCGGGDAGGEPPQQPSGCGHGSRKSLDRLGHSDRARQEVDARRERSEG
jgi:hypothetical protein